jgi:hypothetical protein
MCESEASFELAESGTGASAKRLFFTNRQHAENSAKSAGLLPRARSFLVGGAGLDGVEGVSVDHGRQRRQNKAMRSIPGILPGDGGVD